MPLTYNYLHVNEQQYSYQMKIIKMHIKPHKLYKVLAYGNMW